MRNCRNRKVNRGPILCSRKQGSAPAGNTIEKANRDVRYASLLASMQNTQWSQACRQKSQPRSLSPPLMRSTKQYPNQGPEFYRYVERHSGRRNYYLGRSRSIAAN